VFRARRSRKSRLRFVKLCFRVGNSLAADRTTKFFPMIIAQFFLIFDIGISFFRAKGRAQRTGDYVNMDVLSVAFASLFFWLIPTVGLGSIIGVSQSAHSVPRIFLQFSKMSNEPALAPPNVLQHDRELNGGIYSWQPRRRPRSSLEYVANSDSGQDRRAGVVADVLLFIRSFKHHIAPASTIAPIFITSLACITGLITAYLVPPSGFECRHLGMLSIFFAWILSWLGGLVLLPSRTHPWHFYMALGKDIIFAVGTLAGLALGQAGIYNRCACYTIWNGKGIIIPGYLDIHRILTSRIVKEYPAIIIGAGIGVQLVLVPLLVYWNYRLAFKVFLRGDNGKDLPRAHRKTSAKKSWRPTFHRSLGQKLRVGKRRATFFGKFRWPSFVLPSRNETTIGHEMPNWPAQNTLQRSNNYLPIPPPV
jgi:hypothetical protein